MFQPSESWTSEAFDSSARYEAWTEALSQLYGGWSSALPSSSTFAATVDCRTLDAFKVIECVCEPCAATRSRCDMAADRSEFLALQLVMQGREQVQFGDERIMLSPGDMLVWDTTRPMSFRVVERLHKISVILPLFRFQSWLPKKWRTIRHVIPHDQGTGRLLASYLASLSPRKSADALRNSDALIETTIGLLVNAVEIEPAAAPISRRELHLERVRHYIQEHLGERDLTPNRIAAACGISVRYLHWLFEDFGASVSQYIVDQRLECCRRDLENPAMQERKIADIALSWGFGDVTHFCRRFKQQFGVSPRAFCRERVDQSRAEGALTRSD